MNVQNSYFDDSPEINCPTSRTEPTNIVAQVNPDLSTGPSHGDSSSVPQTPSRGYSRPETDSDEIHLPSSTRETPSLSMPRYMSRFGPEPVSLSRFRPQPPSPFRPESSVNIDNPSEVEGSWDVVLEQVKEYDKERIGSWVEDINTLLVFAGLLSAVVTAFTIESYQWLQEDPADVTVALLTQISQQLTQQSFLPPTTQRQSFQPSSSSIRINCFWFLSLILSLATSLFALLCKQWLHENQREAPMDKPERSLALRQMRYDSLEKGKVPTIVGMLPVLIEFSLLSFFAGLLDLFWSLNVVPLVIVGCVLIGSSTLLYFMTTIIPGLTLVRVFHRDTWSQITRSERPQSKRPQSKHPHSEHPQTYRLFWPYKSPQAWAFFRFIIPITSWPFPGTGRARILRHVMQRLLAWSTSWPDIDSALIDIWQPAREDIDIHLWEGIKFTLRRFDHVPELQHHLQTILRLVSPEIALPMSMPGYYRAYTWINSDNLTIDSFFGDTNPKRNKLYTELGIPREEPPPDRELVLRVITNNLKLDALPKQFDKFVEESRRISEENVPKRTGINFTLLFHVAERIWKGNRGVELFNIYRSEWRTYSNFLARNPENISITGDERYQLIASFARYINMRLHLDPPPPPLPSPPSPPSPPPVPPPPPAPDVLLTKEGLDFLNFVHNQIIEHKLYDMVRYDRIAIFDVEPTSQIIDNWVKAMEVVRDKRELGEDYFAKFPPSEAPAYPDTQDPRVTVGRFRELRNGIVTFIRNALTRQAGSTADSRA